MPELQVSSQNIQLTFTAVLPRQNSRFGEEQYLLNAKFSSPYALSVEENIVVGLTRKDLLLMKPWEKVSDIVKQEAFRKLPEDFFPAWAPV